jgi:cytoskeletal protein RodZ
MPEWVWIVIVVAVVIALALGVWVFAVGRRRARLPERFGPEYDRAVSEQGTGRWIFPAGLVERVARDEETVYLARAKDEIESAPEFDEDHSTEPTYREQIGAYDATGAMPREPTEDA